VVAQFDPANAGRMLMQGDSNAINSQNQALASMGAGLQGLFSGSGQGGSGYYS
jgi:hypothetical protein